jgi:hypothetical protein
LGSEDNLFQLLNQILSKFEDIRYDTDDLKIKLEALSTLLGVISDLDLKNIKKVKHDFLYEKMIEIINKSNSTHNKFLAAYTKQALVRIPNDESKAQSFVRRCIQVGKGVGNLKDCLQQKDPSKLLDAFLCFKEAFDFQEEAKLWYDELNYIKFLAINRNFSTIEFYLSKIKKELCHRSLVSCR